MIPDWRDRMVQAELAAFILVALGNLFTFIGVLTPSWQVAEDTDTGRNTESGLWIYCPGGQACWYIFSDDLINYYEKVDVCRFLLIGDCRKKLLRTPYFFGWHYAVLIMEIIAMLLGAAAIATIVYLHFRRHLLRIGTIILDVLLFLTFLVSSVALSVFVINAEMLESRYLIGVKNIFLVSRPTHVPVLFAEVIWLLLLPGLSGDDALAVRLVRGDPRDHVGLLRPRIGGAQCTARSRSRPLCHAESAVDPLFQQHSQYRQSPLRPYLPSSLIDQGTPLRAGTIDSRHSGGSPLPPPDYVPTTRTFLSY